VCVCGGGGWRGVTGCTGAGVRMRACSLTYPARNAPPNYYLQPLWYRHIFRHCLINGTLFGKKLLSIRCVFWFSLQLLFETYLFLRRIQRDIVINVKTSSCKVPFVLVGFQWNSNLLDRFFGKAKISDSIKFSPVGAEMFHADGRTDTQIFMTKLIVAFRNFANASKKHINTEWVV
jgi:hypothetical protein